MVRSFSGLIAVGALILAAPAVAAPADHDVQCFMASNVFANADKDPARKALAAAAGLYYLGRLDARLSPDQLKAQITAQGKMLNPQSLGPTMTACAKELQAKQTALRAMGQDLARTQGKK